MRSTRPLILIMFLLLAGGAVAGEEGAGEDADKKQVETLLEGLQQAAREKDPAALQRAFDLAAVIASWERAGHLRGVSEKNLAGVKTALSGALNTAIGRGQFLQPFESYEIRSVTAGAAPDTFLAYVRLQSEGTGTTKLHLSLIRRGRTLHIYEIDDLETGLAIMAFVGTMLVETRTGAVRGMAEMARTLQRAQSLVTDESFREAYELLAPAQEHDLPDALHAFIQLTLAGASLGAEEFARAIDHTNQAVELKPNTPLVHYIRAHAWNLLGEPARALNSAQAYFEAVGDDPDVDLQMGWALLALDRQAEALVPLRRVMAQDGFEAEALAYFACAMTGGQQSELKQYFDRLQDPASAFPEMAEICIDLEVAVALRRLTDLYAKVAPGDFQVPFYRGRALLMEGKAAEAAPLLRSALGQLGNRKMDAEEKGPYIEAWLDAMAQQQKHLEAFDQAPDRHLALTWLAEGIAVHGDADLLSELLARAAKDEALLPWRRYYSAEVHFLRRQFEDAIRVLTPLHKELRSPAEEDDALLELVWKVEDRLIRASVRTTGADLEAALRLANEIAKRDDDLDYRIIVLAHKGDVVATTAAIRRAVEAGRDPTWLFEDEDIGEILEGEAYKALREEVLR